MSTHLGLTAGAFRGIVDTPSQTLSSSSLDVIQYLAVAKTISSLKPEGGCALHHDRGLLTLIWSDTVEGLQVKIMMLFPPYKHVATNTCSSPNTTERLLQVPVTACKPDPCCCSASIDFFKMHCRLSTLRVACLRMFLCQRDTSWSFLATLYSEQLVASTKQLHTEWSVKTSSFLFESTCVLLHAVNNCCVV